MAEAETRSTRQCTYVPLRNDLPVTESFSPARSPASAGRPLMMLAAVRATFLHPELRMAAQKTGALSKVPNAGRILAALAADERGDTEAAFAQIANVSLASVQRFATAAIEAQRSVMRNALGEFSEAWHVRTPATSTPSNESNESPFLNAFGAISSMARQDLLAMLPTARTQPPLVVAETGDSTAALRARSPADIERMLTQTFVIREGLIRDLIRFAKVDPAGVLHLERLEMTPIGTAIGDLAYSITLLPGETVRLTHRDWSRTENEFVRIVESTIERATEEALTEKSELTDATQTQRQHSLNMSASLSASGGFGFMNIAASAAASVSDSESSSKNTTIQRSREATSKASSRVKQEQKTSFRVDATFEVENTSFREIRNDSAEPVRWDFHRVLREWRVQLYRYGLRLTYDLIIPEPGSYLMRRYFALQSVEKQLLDDRPPQPPSLARIATEWAQLAEQYNIVLDPPPESKEVVAAAEVTYNDIKYGSGFLELDAGDGYHISQLHAIVEDAYKNPSEESPGTRTGHIDALDRENQIALKSAGYPARLGWRYRYSWFNEPVGGQVMHIRVQGWAKPSEQRVLAWRGEMFNRLAEAVRNRHEEEVQRLTRKRDELLREIAGYDVLSLRRIEREEIMKGVLRWLLGPSFRFTPDLSDILFSDPSERRGESADLHLYTEEGAVRADSYQAVLRHASLIRFLHHAVEWEGVNFILYPYFWAEPERWDLKQRLMHADDMHWNFLRAGAARVVLTIRPGFERDFLALMETFSTSPLPSSHPYVRLADEVKERAKQLDDAEGAAPLATWTEYTPTNAFDVRRGSGGTTS